MELLDAGVVIAAAPAVAFVYQQLYWHASYQAHKLQKLDQSATETQMTETTSPASTQQK